MEELIGLALGQIIGAALLSLLHAKILQWRAVIKYGRTVGFAQACGVSLKANAFAIVSADIVMIGAAYALPSNADAITQIGTLTGLCVWWMTHANLLMSLFKDGQQLSPKDARALSANVFAYLVGSFLITGMAFVALFSIWQAFRP